jgi:glutathione S-transferase
MKLRWAAGSPFVRKVTVTAIETGLDGRIERIDTDYRPLDSDLVKDNPLGKVPALIRDDGSVLADSPVICAWLDSLHDGPKLIPAEGEARWRALNLEGLGDGIGEAAIAVQRERNRPDGKRWDVWEDRNAEKFRNTMSWLDANARLLDGPVTIGQIAIACALGWTEFRVPDLLADAETRWPKVMAWYRKFCERPSMRATVPR